MRLTGLDPTNHPVISLRNVRGTSNGLTVFPCVQEATVDGYGYATILVTTVSGALTAGDSVAWNPVPDFAASTSLILTSATDTSGKYLRELARAFGTAFRLKDGYAITEWFRAIATMLAGMREALTRAIDQAFPDTVSDLIDEWESMLGLPINKYGLLSSRVAAVLAKWRSRRGSSALDILETVRKFDVGAEIYENSSVDVYPVDIRFTHLFAIIVSSAVWADATTRAAIRTAVDSMKPAYTDYNLATRRGFRCDDAESLTDRDVLS